MQLPPAVIVHGLADARLAMSGGRPVTLLSGYGAASYAGGLWWQELLREAGFTGPALLDCADAPGRALEALRLGLPGIVIACHPVAYAQIAQIAAAQNTLLLPAAPPALDLALPGGAHRLAAWLAG